MQRFRTASHGDEAARYTGVRHRKSGIRPGDRNNKSSDTQDDHLSFYGPEWAITVATCVVSRYAGWVENLEGEYR